MSQTPSNLIKYLNNISDPRRKQGQRHDLQTILLITTMSIMSGYIGYRAIGDFMQRNKKDLIASLKPKKGILPSFDVIREVLISIDFDALSKQFYNWSKQYIKVSKKEWLSIDGKAIRGTVTDKSTINQSFVSLVSLYCSKKQLVIGNSKVTLGKSNEINVVQQLLETLDLTDVIFTLDALHCQKKQQTSL
jgi:hypothetical protein